MIAGFGIIGSNVACAKFQVYDGFDIKGDIASWGRYAAGGC